MKLAIPTMFALLLLSLNVQAMGGWGEEVYNDRCIECHSSPDPLFPVIHGQQSYYIRDALHHYANNRRVNPIMRAVVRKLSFNELNSVANYLSSRRFCDIDVIVDAKDGNPLAGESKISHEGCRNCHGRNFQGMAGPRLAGQKTDYLIQALTDYKNQIRKTHPQMSSILGNYSQQDISDISAFLNSLRNKVCR
jgi:cytochrome c553